jgi:hypothetical protein
LRIQMVSTYFGASFIYRPPQKIRILIDGTNHKFLK